MSSLFGTKTLKVLKFMVCLYSAWAKGLSQCRYFVDNKDETAVHIEVKNNCII